MNPASTTRSGSWWAMAAPSASFQASRSRCSARATAKVGTPAARARLIAAQSGTSVPAATTCATQLRVVQDRLQRGAAAGCEHDDPERHAATLSGEVVAPVVVPLVVGGSSARPQIAGHPQQPREPHRGEEGGVIVGVVVAGDRRRRTRLARAAAVQTAEARARARRPPAPRRRRPRRAARATGRRSAVARPRGTAALPAQQDHQQPRHERGADGRAEPRAPSPAHAAASRATSSPATSGVRTASAQTAGFGAPVGTAASTGKAGSRPWVAPNSPTCVPLPTAKPGPGEVGRAGDRDVGRGQHAEQQHRHPADARHPARARALRRGRGAAPARRRRRARPRRGSTPAATAPAAHHRQQAVRACGRRAGRAARWSARAPAGAEPEHHDGAGDRPPTPGRCWCRASRTGRRPVRRR